MRTLLLVALLVIAESAQSTLDPHVTVAAAKDASDIKQGDSFALVASISASQGDKKAEGKYRLIWLSKDKWREDVVMGPDYISNIEAEGKLYDKYSSRKAQYVLEPFLNIGAYPAVPLSGKASIKVEKKKRDGHELQCFTYREERHPDQQICIGQDNLIVSSNDLQYGDFRSALGKRFPFEWHARINSIDYAGKVDSLQSVKNVSQQLFAMDDTWHAYPVHCDHVEPADIISAPKPHYPERARASRVQGAVVIRAFINAQGEIEDAVVVSGQPALQEAALEAVKQWKYKPTKCGGAGVPVDTTITINFSLGG